MYYLRGCICWASARKGLGQIKKYLPKMGTMALNKQSPHPRYDWRDTSISNKCRFRATCLLHLFLPVVCANVRQPHAPMTQLDLLWALARVLVLHHRARARIHCKPGKKRSFRLSIRLVLRSVNSPLVYIRQRRCIQKSAWNGKTHTCGNSVIYDLTRTRAITLLWKFLHHRYIERIKILNYSHCTLLRALCA